jgi:hypothetical protein
VQLNQIILGNVIYETSFWAKLKEVTRKEQRQDITERERERERERNYV